MPKHTITFVEIDSQERNYLTSRLHVAGAKIQYFNQSLTTRLLPKIKDTTILGCFIDSQVTAEIINQLPKLQMIVTMSTGYDHIDLVTCAKRKITVTNIPFYGENTVAEHAFALLLAVSRKIPAALERAKSGNFSAQGLTGFDLMGKTIGIVGMGRIGQHMTRIAHGFGMNVIAFDPFKNDALAKELNFTYATLSVLLKKSDIISLHAPHNDKTHHLINQGNIKLIKKGAVLINTARGELIETDALVSALKKNIIAGAGLDVLEEECMIREEKELLTKAFQPKCDLTTVLQNHVLIQDPRVLVTPHNAFNSREANERIMDTTIENIMSYVKGKRINVVK